MEHLWWELLIKWQLDFAVESGYSGQDHKTNFLQYLEIEVSLWYNIRKTRIELDINDFFKFYSKAQIENAVLYAKDLNNRFTVLWLNFDIFGTKEPLLS